MSGADTGIAGRPDWLSDANPSWPLKRAKFLLRERGELSADGSETLLSVSEYYGVKPRSESHSDEAFLTRAETLEGYKVVRKGDLAMNIMLAWKGSQGVSEFDGIVSPAYAVFELDADELHPGYAHHLFRSDVYVAEFRRRSTGIIESRLRLYPESFGGIPVLLPTMAEQRAIASYLDAETARIDGLIQEKQRLAVMLAELRGGVIRERTTGTDLKVERVVTGDQFMPNLPRDWRLVALGRYARITNGSTPLKDNPAFWQGGHYPWLNSSVVNGDEVTQGSELVTSEALRQCHLPIVSPGSVLVALTGQGKTRGQATVLRIEATINQHLAAIVCDEDHLDGEFVFWALTGQYAALRMVSDGQGGTKGALTCDELGRFRIPKPPIHVQRSIARALYEETRKIDELLHHVEAEIAFLQELRSATITDAVLGRIDVRKHMKH